MKIRNFFTANFLFLSLILSLLSACGKEKKVKIVAENSQDKQGMNEVRLNEKSRKLNYACLLLELDLKFAISEEDVIQITREDKKGNILPSIANTQFPDFNLCEKLPGVSDPYDSSGSSMWMTAYSMKINRQYIRNDVDFQIYFPWNWLAENNNDSLFFIGFRIYSSEKDTTLVPENSKSPMILKEKYYARFEVNCKVPEFTRNRMRIDTLQIDLKPTEAHNQDFVLFPFGKRYGYPDLCIQMQIENQWAWRSPVMNNSLSTGKLELPPMDLYPTDKEVKIQVVDKDDFSRDDELGFLKTNLDEICMRGRSASGFRFGKVQLLRISCRE